MRFTCFLFVSGYLCINLVNALKLKKPYKNNRAVADSPWENPQNFQSEFGDKEIANADLPTLPKQWSIDNPKESLSHISKNFGGRGMNRKKDHEVDAETDYNDKDNGSEMDGTGSYEYEDIDGTRRDKYTYTALIDIVFTDGCKRTCTGAIIHENVILTAAHCFTIVNAPFIKPELSLSFIVIGSKRMIETGYEQYLPIERVITHPRYRGWTADLALVFTFANMEADKPGHILKLATVDDSVHMESKVTVMSWGRCSEDTDSDEPFRTGEVYKYPNFTQDDLNSQDKNNEDGNEEHAQFNIRLGRNSESSLPRKEPQEKFKSILADFAETNKNKTKYQQFNNGYKPLEDEDGKIHKYKTEIVKTLKTRGSRDEYYRQLNRENKNRYDFNSRANYKPRQNENSERKIVRSPDSDWNTNHNKLNRREMSYYNKFPSSIETFFDLPDIDGKKFVNESKLSNTLKNYTEFIIKENIKKKGEISRIDTHHNSTPLNEPILNGISSLRRDSKGNLNSSIISEQQRIVLRTFNNNPKEQKLIKPNSRKFISRSLHKNNMQRRNLHLQQQKNMTIGKFVYVNLVTCKRMIEQTLPPIYELQNQYEHFCYSSEDFFITTEDSGAPVVLKDELVAITIGGVQVEGEHVAVGIKVACFCTWIAENLPNNDGSKLKCCNNCCNGKPRKSSGRNGNTYGINGLRFRHGEDNDTESVNENKDLTNLDRS